MGIPKGVRDFLKNVGVLFGADGTAPDALMEVLPVDELHRHIEVATGLVASAPKNLHNCRMSKTRERAHFLYEALLGLRQVVRLQDLDRRFDILGEYAVRQEDRAHSAVTEGPFNDPVTEAFTGRNNHGASSGARMASGKRVRVPRAVTASSRVASRRCTRP